MRISSCTASFANTGLLNSHRPLDGGAGRALTGTLVRRPVLLNADPEVGGQLVGVAVGQRGICALDAAQCGGRDLDRGGQFGLGEAPDYAPVAGIAVVRVGIVTTRSIGASRMRMTRARRSTCGVLLPDSQLKTVAWETSARRDRSLTLMPFCRRALGEGLRVESAQHATRHARSAPRFIVEQIHRVPLNLSMLPSYIIVLD